MKRILVVSLCYAAVLFALPFFISRPSAASADDAPPAARPGWGDTLKVYNHKTDKVMLLDSFDYKKANKDIVYVKGDELAAELEAAGYSLTKYDGELTSGKH